VKLLVLQIKSLTKENIKNEVSLWKQYFNSSAGKKFILTELKAFKTQFKGGVFDLAFS
jgi:hypothetical protein